MPWASPVECPLLAMCAMTCRLGSRQRPCKKNFGDRLVGCDMRRQSK